jgi:quercetin dioxygenase-like cupin family protein
MDTSDRQHANNIFPKGERAPTDYFTGRAWVQLLVSNNSSLHCQVANVVFEPAARNNWHSHPGGQILIATEGTGYYQEKGKPIQLVYKGDTVHILPGIEHWHGASHNSAFTHIAINPNTQEGIVNWLEPVKDEEYNKYK